jgi:hypothetical protein
VYLISLPFILLVPTAALEFAKLDGLVEMEIDMILNTYTPPIWVTSIHLNRTQRLESRSLFLHSSELNRVNVTGPDRSSDGGLDGWIDLTSAGI